MIKDLAKLATRLDRLGLTKEADVLDSTLQKLAQQVATTGVEGATYSAGRQITPGYAGGPTVKFYKAKPKSISEFNAFLGALITNAAADPRQTAFSPSVVNNLPSKSDTTWGRKTKAAFKEYAVAAGFPEAGTNWEAFANKSGKYEPTMNGIFSFWEDTIAKVDYDVAVTQLVEQQSRDLAAQREEESAESAAKAKSEWDETYGKRKGRGVDMPAGPSYDPLNPLADLKLPESASSKGGTGVSGVDSRVAKDFLFEYTWVNRGDPINSLAYWNISDDNKKRILEAWNDRDDFFMSAKDWCRQYIYDNQIPGGWLTRGPGGGQVQSAMAPITSPPEMPAKIDPRQLDSMGGSFQSFKDEVERFPNQPITFRGWTSEQLNKYLAEHGFSRDSSGKLIDNRR